MNESKIDFVITWVDGNDPQWQKEYQLYSNREGDSRLNRFRDWKNLKYIFRAFDEFTPWVNNIFFVTYGHLPGWLNTNHKKLTIVKHEDIIAADKLPIFNSCAIEVNLHKIRGLSEYFVYFNDDTFLLKPIPQQFFFRKNLPVNAALCNVLHIGDIAHIELNNIDILNKHFYKQKNAIIRRNFYKWFYPGYGTHSFRTLLLMAWPIFSGFKKYHHPQPFLKSTFEDLWNKEAQLLEKVSSSKFRSHTDISQYAFKYWQFASGTFSPESYRKAYKKRKYIGIHNRDDANRAKQLIENKNLEMLCINDATSKGRFTEYDMTEQEFIHCRNIINAALQKLLPNKSSFELN